MKNFKEEYFGSIHIKPDGNIAVEMPEDGEYNSEKYDRAKAMIDFIIFAVNSPDCISLFNVADKLNSSVKLQNDLIQQVENNISKIGVTLNYDEIWQFIDDVQADKVKFQDKVVPTPDEQAYLLNWLDKHKKLTWH